MDALYAHSPGPDALDLDWQQLLYSRQLEGDNFAVLTRTVRRDTVPRVARRLLRRI